MKTIFSSAALLLASLSANPAFALVAAVGTIEGAPSGQDLRTDLSNGLQQLKNIEMLPARSLARAAAGQGYSKGFQNSPTQCATAAHCVGAQVVVFGKFFPPEYQGDDGTLTLNCYRGQDGERTHTVTLMVRNGVPDPQLWSEAAMALAPILTETNFPALQAAAPQVAEPAPQTKPAPKQQARTEFAPPNSFEDEPKSERIDPIFRGVAGLAIAERDFESSFSAAHGGPFSEGGLSYNSSMVPGFAIDLEFYPLRFAMQNAASGLGLHFRYEKLFLTTEQTGIANSPNGENVFNQKDLETFFHNMSIGLLYRKRLGSKLTSPEILGGIDFERFGLTINGSSTYCGALYNALALSAGASIPLGTRYVSADLVAQVLPFASLGDYTEELGGDVSTFGYALEAGLTARIQKGFLARAAFEWRSLSNDITGQGRNHREGITAEDHYMTLRFMLGYEY